MIVEFKLDTKDSGDLAVIGFLFNHLKVGEIPATDGESATTPEPKKRGRKPKSPKGPTESEIKEMDFDQMSSYLEHKKLDPTDFEVRWFAKLFKNKHDQQDDIRQILNDIGSQNFTDLKKGDFKKFCILLAEKDASITSENTDNDLDI